MLNCYAQFDKQKSLRVMEAFAKGSAGKVASVNTPTLLPGDASFYGIRPSWWKLWQQAIAEKRRWFYIDNSFFDCAREQQFRIGVNAVQSWSRFKSDGKRLSKLGVQVHGWRKSGRNILVCPQTDEFMKTVAAKPNWLRDTEAEIKQFSERPIVVRSKLQMRPFKQDLADAWIVVCHSSAAAVEALCAGVPVIVTDPFAACATFSTSFNDIESPAYRDGRLEFMARLADSQFSYDELRDGTAWKAIQTWNRSASS